ncbi:hypothetical protein HaLaN_22458 [Haematococcus lacustris]|uniref:Uncharacterized protein n=1 Tax=Haematococcus lacustris TaxID=44745 RepID=A0A699ZY94_HAELA|nr:hypothetical protein HaLaN_22458 [Haematococcus lacustris]
MGRPCEGLSAVCLSGNCRLGLDFPECTLGKTGATSTMVGASMFVFDVAGRIAQVFCFGPPLEHVRSQLLAPHASAQHSSSSSSRGIISSTRGRSLVEEGVQARQQHGRGPVRLMN